MVGSELRAPALWRLAPGSVFHSLKPFVLFSLLGSFLSLWAQQQTLFSEVFWHLFWWKLLSLRPPHVPIYLYFSAHHDPSRCPCLLFCSLSLCCPIIGPWALCRQEKWAYLNCLSSTALSVAWSVFAETDGKTKEQIQRNRGCCCHKLLGFLQASVSLST